MKVVALSVLCALVALSQAGGKAEDNDAVDSAGESHVVKRSTSCHSGWTRHNSRCFLYVGAGFTWTQAERNCVSMHANLASVHSSEEYRFIQKLIWTFTHANGEAWIGGSDAQEENVWLWSDGRAFHYTNWCQGQPDNYGGNQNCLQMNFADGKCFDDLQCNALRPSVCAKTI